MSARASALLARDEQLARTLPAPAMLLEDGQMVSCAGSKDNVYTLTRHTVGQYHCNCPAYMFGKGFKSGYRTCKHLRALLGDAHELIRAPSTAPLPKLAKKLIQFTEYVPPSATQYGPPTAKAKEEAKVSLQYEAGPSVTLEEPNVKLEPGFTVKSELESNVKLEPRLATSHPAESTVDVKAQKVKVERVKKEKIKKEPKAKALPKPKAPKKAKALPKKRAKKIKDEVDEGNFSDDYKEEFEGGGSDDDFKPAVKRGRKIKNEY